MTRAQFMNELRERLDRLPSDEREEALAYYEEYFDEAGVDHEQDVIRELGSPASVASRIYADRAVKAARASPHNPGKGLSAIWFILLAIFAAPLALPAIAGLIGVVIAILATIFGIGIAAIALLVGGLVTFISGFVGLFSMPATALVMFGAAFILWGIGKIIFAIMGAVLSLMSQFISWLFDRSAGGYHG
ncbi:MAG TPA: DUF1700 domain-containing protein [Treponemataceae bacterium]|jgi:uncharacterized membrane protein|nr:DUF1700 domain-containing protein [Treponemataceae bacterium]